MRRERRQIWVEFEGSIEQERAKGTDMGLFRAP